MDLTSFLPSLLPLLLILCCVVAIKIAILFAENTHSNQPEFQLEANLLTPAEMVFFNFLSQNLDAENFHVATKVRLADVFNCVSKGRLFQVGFNKIRAKHFDFVIVSRKDSKILLAIELDDRTHNQTKAKKNDVFKNELCVDAGLKLVRVPVRRSYDESTLALFSIQ